jgi:hypothetical protein
MSCGCRATPTIDRAADERARAAMCHICEHARRDPFRPWEIGAVECRISGEPTLWHIRTPQPTCPKGRHAPLVRWLGVVWYGVPYPIRLALRRRLKGMLPGCGCIKVIKDWTNKEIAIWNSALVSMGSV